MLPPHFFKPYFFLLPVSHDGIGPFHRFAEQGAAFALCLAGDDAAHIGEFCFDDPVIIVLDDEFLPDPAADEPQGKRQVLFVAVVVFLFLSHGSKLNSPDPFSKHPCQTGYKLAHI